MSGPVLRLREADGDERQPLAIRGSVFVLEGCVCHAVEAWTSSELVSKCLLTTHYIYHPC